MLRTIIFYYRIINLREFIAENNRTNPENTNREPVSIRKCGLSMG